MIEAWSPLNPEDASFVGQSRLDYICYLEQMGTPPKVAFEDCSELKQWLSEEFDDYEVQPVLGGRNAIRVKISDDRFTFLEQLWVRKSYSDYRKAMRYVAKNFHATDDVSAIDADHIVARTILKDFPNSWVAIFPTYKSSNSGFGPVERALPKAKKGFKSISLSPLMAFKIANGKMPRSIEELNSAMVDIRGQIFCGRNNYLRSLICDMREEVSKHLIGKQI
jgi:hypothetical protein